MASKDKEHILQETEDFWQKWTEAAFPDLNTRTYFLPPLYFSHVPSTRQLIAKKTKLEANVLKQADPSTVKGDTAMKHMFKCLEKFSEENKEVMFVLSNLQFRDYLGEPAYAPAAALLNTNKNLPQPQRSSDQPRNLAEGDFDFLLIHQNYGLVTCEVKSVGDFKSGGTMTENNRKLIQERLTTAISQLNKAEGMLSHLVHTTAPNLRITKTIALPNLTTKQLLDAIASDDQLIKDLRQCLGTTDPSNIPGLCLCCDQLSDPKTPCDVSSHVLRELGHWWQRRVAGAGPVSHMTSGVYKTLVARFCGPATTVTVPCTCPPRVSVKTLGQAVWWTGECYTADITLFPEQVHLLHTAPPRVFLTGPPGTGKTVVLLLMGIKWMLGGHHVHVVSSCDGSRAASRMLYHLLLQTVKTQQSPGVSPGQPLLLEHHLDSGEHAEKAINDLSQAAKEGSLYVIADEVSGSTNFHTVCDRLLTQVPDLHLWAASCFHGDAPPGWQVEYLTRPLRSPPAVVREVEQNAYITDRHVHPYIERGVADHTHGPQVTRVYHGEGHSGRRPDDCVTCGREVASFLLSLRDGGTENVTTTATTVTSTNDACLQWKDVLVLDFYYTREDSAMMKGLQEAGIPVQVMTDDDMEDVATARSDVVWVTRGLRVSGLERKVVVCLEENLDARFYSMSRCTSLLVFVCSYHQRNGI